MYNVGEKVKAVATALLVVDIVGFFILAIVYFAIAARTRNSVAILTGFVVLFAGGFVSWAQYVLIRAFGVIAENSDILVNRLKNVDVRLQTISTNTKHLSDAVDYIAADGNGASVTTDTQNV